MSPGVFVDQRSTSLQRGGNSDICIQRGKIFHCLNQQKLKYWQVVTKMRVNKNTCIWQKFKQQNLAIFSKVEVVCLLLQESQEFPEFLFQLCESVEIEGSSASCYGPGWASCPMFLIFIVNRQFFIFQKQCLECPYTTTLTTLPILNNIFLQYICYN